MIIFLVETIRELLWLLIIFNGSQKIDQKLKKETERDYLV